MSDEPNFNCPMCGTPSTLIVGPTQAFCTNKETCVVLTFNPSLPDGGMSQLKCIIDIQIEEK